MADVYPELQPGPSWGSKEEIRRVAGERNAVILAHNYERPEVQDVADFVGDSLGLSREAAKTDADVIVFCGVHFMAETAAILSPQKTVLLPDLAAGCSLAATIDAEQLREWKAEHPGAVVVSYVNTTAEVKAESDYCCTSGNAVEIVNSIPADREILFLPDMFLGAHVRRITGRKNIHVWMGECHVHAGIDPENIRLQRSLHPGGGVPDSPRVRLLDERGRGDVRRRRRSGGRADPLDRRDDQAARRNPARTSSSSPPRSGSCTGCGARIPARRFYAANERASCAYMKVTTLPKVLASLRRMEHRITVPEGDRRARAARDRAHGGDRRRAGAGGPRRGSG